MLKLVGKWPKADLYLALHYIYTLLLLSTPCTLVIFNSYMHSKIDLASMILFVSVTMIILIWHAYRCFRYFPVGNMLLLITLYG